MLHWLLFVTVLDSKKAKITKMLGYFWLLWLQLCCQSQTGLQLIVVKCQQLPQ